MQKNNFLPLRLETYLAWTFLFLYSFLNNYPWTFEKNSFFNKLWIYRVGLKQKIRRSQGEKLAKRGIKTTAVTQKKYNKNIETLLVKQNFSLLIWDRQLKFMLQHPTVRFDRKQSKYLSKELLLCMIFCTRGRLISERLWRTTLPDHSINKPLKNLRLSYWRSIWRQNCLDMYHWALGRSEKFYFDQFEN